MARDAVAVEFPDDAKDAQLPGAGRMLTAPSGERSTGAPSATIKGAQRAYKSRLIQSRINMPKSKSKSQQAQVQGEVVTGHKKTETGFEKSKKKGVVEIMK